VGLVGMTFEFHDDTLVFEFIHVQCVNTHVLGLVGQFADYGFEYIVT
jgi:hypothetical protein